jgi:tetratricopeptide (TPR) repeat protein
MWLVLFFCILILPRQAHSQNTSPLQKAELQVKQHPQSAEAQNAWGEALDEAGQLEPARQAFERAIALKAGYGAAYLNLGLVCMQLRAPKKAAPNLDQAIKLLGNSSEAGYALYLRAKIYTEQGDLDNTLKSLNRAVSLRPDLAEIWSDLGEARRAKSDDPGALVAFQKAVDLNPQDPVAQYRLGSEYLRQDKNSHAVEHLRLAYQRNPQDQSVLNALQTALRKQGKVAEADEIRAQLAQQLRGRDVAMQNAVTAIKLNNEGAQLEKQGELQAALEKYRQAVHLNPDHVGIRVNYAVALLRLGQWTDGLNEMHEALQRDPGNVQIQAALKDALSQAPRSLIPKWNDAVPK